MYLIIFQRQLCTNTTNKETLLIIIVRLVARQGSQVQILPGKKSSVEALGKGPRIYLLRTQILNCDEDHTELPS